MVKRVVTAHTYTLYTHIHHIHIYTIYTIHMIHTHHTYIPMNHCRLLLSRSSLSLVPRAQSLVDVLKPSCSLLHHHLWTQRSSLGYRDFCKKDKGREKAQIEGIDRVRKGALDPY